LFIRVDPGVSDTTPRYETRYGGLLWDKVALARAANEIRTHAADGTPMVYAIGTEAQLH